MYSLDVSVEGRAAPIGDHTKSQGDVTLRKPSLKVDDYDQADVATWVPALFNGRKRCCSIILPGGTKYEHLSCSKFGRSVV